MGKRKPKTLVEVFAEDDRREACFANLRQVAKRTSPSMPKAERAANEKRGQKMVESIRAAIDELSERAIWKYKHIRELDDIGRQLEIIVQEIDDG